MAAWPLVLRDNLRSSTVLYCHKSTTHHGRRLRSLLGYECRRRGVTVGVVKPGTGRRQPPPLRHIRPCLDPGGSSFILCPLPLLFSVTFHIPLVQAMMVWRVDRTGWLLCHPCQNERSLSAPARTHARSNQPAWTGLLVIQNPEARKSIQQQPFQLTCIQTGLQMDRSMRQPLVQPLALPLLEPQRPWPLITVSTALQRAS